MRSPPFRFQFCIFHFVNFSGPADLISDVFLCVQIFSSASFVMVLFPVLRAAVLHFDFQFFRRCSSPFFRFTQFSNFPCPERKNPVHHSRVMTRWLSFIYLFRFSISSVSDVVHLSFQTLFVSNFRALHLQFFIFIFRFFLGAVHRFRFKLC